MNDAALQCRFCACTEDSPCRLVSSEDCVINVLTRSCSAPGCVAAMQALLRRLDREEREARRRMVVPVAQRFIAEQRRRREARNRKLKKFRRAA